MSKRKLEVDWRREARTDFDLPLRKYERYLESQGFRKSTIESYAGQVQRYLEFARTDRPSVETASLFKDSLHDRNLARSTINNYSFAVACYHEMYGEEVSLPFLKRNNELPYYFDEEEVLRIFNVCNNIKHYTMLQVLFYACLRASELCNLDDRDLPNS